MDQTTLSHKGPETRKQLRCNSVNAPTPNHDEEQARTIWRDSWEKAHKCVMYGVQKGNKGKAEEPGSSESQLQSNLYRS